MYVIYSRNYSTSTASGDQQLENTSSHQLTPNTVTIISAEAAKNDFSLVSDYDSIATAQKKTAYTPSGTLLPASDEEAKPDSNKPDNGKFSTEGSDDRTKTSENNCVHGLGNLSLSDKATHGTISSDGQLCECSLVPALFVFGGMDTQETVHCDSFVLVPN